MEGGSSSSSTSGRVNSIGSTTGNENRPPASCQVTRSSARTLARTTRTQRNQDRSRTPPGEPEPEPGTEEEELLQVGHLRRPLVCAHEFEREIPSGPPIQLVIGLVDL